MRQILLLTVFSSGLTWGLDNAVVLHEAAGAVQTDRPVVVSRWFARGEIPHYAQPRWAGVAAPAWQCDAMTRWDDGSLQHALVSFRVSLAANGNVRVDFINNANRSSAGNVAATEAAALTQQQMLDFGGGQWSAVIEATTNSIARTASARTLVAGGHWRYWLRGPVVTWVVVEDASPALSADFGWEYNGTAWVEPSQAKFRSLHPMFSLQFWPDPDGVGPSAAWPGVRVDAAVENPWTTRFQTQIYDVAIRRGVGGADTVWSQLLLNHHAKSRWHQTFWDGTEPQAVVTDFNLPYLVHSRALPSYDLTRTVSDASLSIELQSYNNNLGDDEPQFCKSNVYCGSWLKALSTTGGRGDIAFLPRWYLKYLYAMGNSAVGVSRKLEAWKKLVLGNADAAGNMPMHYRESDTSAVRDAPADGQRYYFNCVAGACVDAATPAFGKVVSIATRPTAFVCCDFEDGGSGVNAADVIIPLCTASGTPCYHNQNDKATINQWQIHSSGDQAHAPSVAYIPYLLTGDPYYLQEVQSWAALTVSSVNPGPALGARFGSLGYMSYDNNIRAHAWMLRNVFHAAMTSPDGTPEKPYFTEIVKANAAIDEGRMRITNGAFPPSDAACTGYNATTTADKWCIGRMTMDGGRENPLKYWGISAPGFLSCCDGSKTYASYAQYMYHYLGVVFGAIADSRAVMVGNQPVYEAVLDTWGRSLINNILHPSANPYDVEAIGAPGTRVSDRLYFDSYAARNDGFSRSAVLVSAMTALSTSFVIDQAVNTNGGFVTSWDFNINPMSVQVDSEVIAICSYTANSPAAGLTTLYACTNSRGGRGLYGSGASIHSPGAPVRLYRQNFSFNRLEPQGGYAMLARAALSFLTRVSDGISNGRRAWEWIDGAVDWKQQQGGYTGTCTNTSNLAYCDVPMWAIVPREEVANVVAESSGGAALLRYQAPSGASCRVYVGAAAASTSSDDPDFPDGGGGRSRTFLAEGLTPGQLYHYRVSCGTTRATGQFTATGGTGTGSIELRLAGLSGAATVVVEHGATPSLGSVEPAQACTTGCVAVLAGVPIGPRYVRWTYLGAVGQPLGRGGAVRMTN